ncbi:hypothetical protein VIBNISFn118_250013 [Vibrio nigripulchritudo SFn118]|nr:hypothetical protein VIBNISFn118_250013 [Vibrio nigripulchritudo SFn118]
MSLFLLSHLRLNKLMNYVENNICHYLDEGKNYIFITECSL